MRIFANKYLRKQASPRRKASFLLSVCTVFALLIQHHLRLWQ